MVRLAALGSRFLVVAGALACAAGAVGAVDDISGKTAAARGFGGRSGATKTKLIVIGCALPDPDANAQGGLVPGLAARIKAARGGPQGDRAKAP